MIIIYQAVMWTLILNEKRGPGYIFCTNKWLISFCNISHWIAQNKILKVVHMKRRKMLGALKTMHELCFTPSNGWYCKKKSVIHLHEKNNLHPNKMPSTNLVMQGLAQTLISHLADSIIFIAKGLKSFIPCWSWISQLFILKKDISHLWDLEFLFLGRKLLIFLWKIFVY